MEHFFFSRGVELSGVLRDPLSHLGRFNSKLSKVLSEHELTAATGNALKGALRGFLIGYGITVAMALFRIISSRRRRKNIPAEVRKAFFEGESVRLAKFLSTCSFSLTALNYLFKWLRGVDDGFNALAAGSVGGLSLLIMRPGRTRSDLSLYVFSRAVDVIVHILSGKKPAAGKFSYFNSVFVFMVLQFVIMHTYSLEKRNLNPSYTAWISLLAGGTVVPYTDAVGHAVMHNEHYTLPSPEADVTLKTIGSGVGAFDILIGSVRSFGTFSTWFQPATESVVDPPKEGTGSEEHKVKVVCSHYHSSCPREALRVAINSYREAFKMYLPLYMIPPLLSFAVRPKFKSLEKLFRSLVLSPLKNTTRSSLFLSIYASLVIFLTCMLRRLVSFDRRWPSSIAGLLCGTSITIEQSRRHAELNLYCLPRAVEAIYNTWTEHVLRTNMKFHQTPLLDVVVFSWSCAVLYWALKHKNEMVRKSFQMILGQLVV